MGENKVTDRGIRITSQHLLYVFKVILLCSSVDNG